MREIEATILSALQVIIGLPLSIARNAGNMKGFHFGRIRPHHMEGKGTVGEYALHVQCPWRIVQAGKILTGLQDYYEEQADEADESAHGSERNLQEKKLFQLLRGYDPSTRSLVNATDGLIVRTIDADAYGGLEIGFSNALYLQIFPDSSVGEAWRFFRPGSDEHFVIGGPDAEVA
jgi:hypothetical protein